MSGSHLFRQFFHDLPDLDGRRAGVEVQVTEQKNRFWVLTADISFFYPDPLPANQGSIPSTTSLGL
jgi:hypothetical protein